ncbi:uncharacterized protein LOC132710425 [Pantherophis guttatus]|uniref:Gypsy retrotransposon integrase-like protein 1 n=1 Tax=Pantherophis guttatus TaxID=94885 RepID=A0ABM3Z236_PANGU|nr:uncharacterized protein LOC132710425 [Pantherophis guttatus]
MDWQHLKQLKPSYKKAQLKTPKSRLVDFNGNPIGILGRATIHIKYNEFNGELPITIVEHSRPNLLDVAVHTQKDPTLRQVKSWILRGWPSEKPEEKFSPFARKQKELSTIKGCLLWGDRVLIPSTLQRRTLETLHKGHPGIVCMKALARSYVWWPSMDKDIEQWVSRCDPCQEVCPAPPQSEVAKWETPSNPWSRIHIDFAGPMQGRHLLIVVDAFSKWLEVVPMASTTTEATIRALRRLFATHGLPDVLVSDNGPQLTSLAMESFLAGLGIRHALSAPYRPAGNGQAERMVRLTKEALTKMRRLRSPLDRLHPQYSPEVTATASRPLRAFSNGDSVFALNFNGSPKWLKGKIASTTGPKSYTVELEDGQVCRRHIDQLRKRWGGAHENQPDEGGLQHPDEVGLQHPGEVDLPHPGEVGLPHPCEAEQRHPDKVGPAHYQVLSHRQSSEVDHHQPDGVDQHQPNRGAQRHPCEVGQHNDNQHHPQLADRTRGHRAEPPPNQQQAGPRPNCIARETREDYEYIDIKDSVREVVSLLLSAPNEFRHFSMGSPGPAPPKGSPKHGDKGCRGVAITHSTPYRRKSPTGRNNRPGEACGGAILAYNRPVEASEGWMCPWKLHFGQQRASGGPHSPVLARRVLQEASPENRTRDTGGAAAWFPFPEAGGERGACCLFSHP